MKKLFFCICLILAVCFSAAVCAEADLLPSIDEVLLGGLPEQKTEVRDNLDRYYSLGEPLEGLGNNFRFLILQREAPVKEFTAKKVYPPFSNSDGFDEDFTGVDIGKSRVWLRTDLMARIPEDFRASSLEDATHLIMAENVYEWSGTVSVSDFKDSPDGELPEFKDAEEMAEYLSTHQRTVESITYYPKFCAYSLVVFYETRTGKSMVYDYLYTAAKRFARNPEAGDQWYNMTCLSDLLGLLGGETAADPQAVKSAVGSFGFVPEEEKNVWLAYVDSGAYSAAYTAIEEYFWTMAGELKNLDPSSENREYYDLIIRDKNIAALSLFVNYCDYSGFDRSVSSIESSGDYIASPDYEWMEQTLGGIVGLFE